MENGWMINLTETPLDGHTPDLTITPYKYGPEECFLLLRLS